jgi:hypothetical protein
VYNRIGYVGDGIFSCFELWMVFGVCHASGGGGRHPPHDSTWSLADLSAAATSIPASAILSVYFIFKMESQSNSVMCCVSLQISNLRNPKLAAERPSIKMAVCFAPRWNYTRWITSIRDSIYRVRGDGGPAGPHISCLHCDFFFFKWRI